MAKSKRPGKGHGLRYTAYKAGKVQEKNRRLKLERALKRNPENEEIKIALKNVGYRRQTPKGRVWSHTDRRIAQLYKEFTGSFNKDILSNNDKLSAAALMDAGKLGRRMGPGATEKTPNYIATPGANQHTMFSIGSQIQ